MEFGFAVSAAYVAPRQDAALVTAADGTVHLFQIHSGSAVELVLRPRYSAGACCLQPVGHGRRTVSLGLD